MKNLFGAALLACFVASCGGSKSPTAPTTTTTTIPPVVTYTITGLVTVGASTVPIAGAVLAVQDGPNVGKSATTDSAGRYTLANLTPSGFTLAVSAAGHDGTSRGINLTASGTANFQLLPTVPFRRIGTGDTVFDMPTYFTRIRVTGTYTGNSSNFIVYVAGRLLVNELLGRAWNTTVFDGTYLTSGGVTEIKLSSGVAWTFTEVR